MKAANLEVSNDGFAPPSMNPGAETFSLKKSSAKAFGTLVEWNRRVTMRNRLLELSPRMMRDMGITLEGAMVESEKPFWRE